MRDETPERGRQTLKLSRSLPSAEELGENSHTFQRRTTCQKHPTRLLRALSTCLSAGQLGQRHLELTSFRHHRSLERDACLKIDIRQQNHDPVRILKVAFKDADECL